MKLWLLKLLFGKKKSKDKFSKETSKKTLNLKKDKKDKRDYTSHELVSSVVKELRPKYVNLTPWSTSIKNQGSLGACSAFAFGGAYEIMRNIMTKTPGRKSKLDVSELFIYYNERKLMDTITEDSGAFLRDGCKSMVSDGASLEEFWPYIKEKFRFTPVKSAYWAGRLTVCSDYYRCYDTGAIKDALVEKYPVVFGMYVYSNYLVFKGDTYKTISGSKVGGHAQVIVGFDDDRKAFLVRNSWGEDWGMNGHVWIPYTIFDKLKMDSWVIRPKS